MDDFSSDTQASDIPNEVLDDQHAHENEDCPAPQLLPLEPVSDVPSFPGHVL